MASLCASCGFNNPPGMRFCGSCGTRLEPADRDSPATRDNPVSRDMQTGSLREIAPQQLGVMMGADLLARLQQAGLEASGQHRNVTVLFTDLTGYTELSQQLDREEVFELVQEYIRLLANAVYKYEGIVDKLTGDGLMALFGAPVAHENNAELALRAALEMQQDVLRLGRQVQPRLGVDVRMRVGLHTGPVVVGGIGSNAMMNYTAIGDTVNLARRIEEAAEPDSILVSESVYRQARMLFEFAPRRELDLKGYRQPAGAYRLVGPRAAPGSVRGLGWRRAPMIGREAEITHLLQAAEALAAHKKGQFILVVGEAGIGKSRLCAEFQARLVGTQEGGLPASGLPASGSQSNGSVDSVSSESRLTVRILEGHSLTYRRTVSYWMFADLLYQWLGLKRGAASAAAEAEAEAAARLVQRAEALFGRRTHGLLPYLERLLSLPYSDPAAAARLDLLEASQLRQFTFRAVRDLFLAEAQRQPLLLLLDDLHWADEASLDLLQFLLDSVRQAPLCILGITRPFQAGRLQEIASWASAHLPSQTLVLKLGSLTVHQSEQLVEELLSAPELPAHLREQIVQRAAGVPFYLEEILRMLVDRGLLRQVEGAWQVSGSEPLLQGVPDNLQGLILARFDRLEPEERLVLGAAAVIGLVFDLELLKACLAPQPVELVEQAVFALVERDFLTPRSGTGGREFSFRHMLMSEAIYSTLLRRERARLHGLVGQALEKLYPERLEEQAELLARHYAWSPRQDKALQYLILAGAKAARASLNEQARQFYHQALELLPQVAHSPSQAAQVHTGLGEALMLAGSYLEARQHYQRALEQQTGAGLDSCALLRRISVTYERQGDYEQAIQNLQSARQALPAEPRPVLEEAQILSDLGWIDFRRGNLERALEHLNQALALVSDGDAYEVIASIYNRLGGVFFQQDLLDQASSYVRKSLVLREGIGDTLGVARSYNNLGLLGWRKGDWVGALENFQRCLELNTSLGDVEGLVHLNSNIGLLQTDRGNLSAARQYLHASLEMALQIGHAFLEALAYMHLSRFYLAAGEWQPALEYSQKSLAMFNELGSHENLVDLYISLGEAWLGLGKLEPARQCGLQALETLAAEHSAEQPSPSRGRALRLLGSIARLQGDLSEAAQLLKRSSEQYTGLGDQLEMGRTLAARAQLAEARGEAREARLFLNEARLIFHQLGAGLDLQALGKNEA